MDLTDNIPGFSKSDKLGLTAFGSVLAHMIVILGISFTVPDLSLQTDLVPTLEITLVNTRSDSEPEEADLLAQANQDGGGDTEKPVVAKSPLPFKPSLVDSANIPVARIASVKRQTNETDLVMLTQDQQETLDLPRNEFQPKPEKKSQPENKPGLLEKSSARLERARLSAEIDQFWETYNKRPRRKFLSARTKEYKYATYMEAWRTRVETVGNLNYPEQARQQKLSGQLILDVEIRPDGNLQAINVIRPSGLKVLDDAAIRIVQLSAPFEPFPNSVREDVDILHITRTWQFVRGGKLTSR